MIGQALNRKEYDQVDTEFNACEVTIALIKERFNRGYLTSKNSRVDEFITLDSNARPLFGRLKTGLEGVYTFEEAHLVADAIKNGYWNDLQLSKVCEYQNAVMHIYTFWHEIKNTDKAEKKFAHFVLHQIGRHLANLCLANWKEEFTEIGPLMLDVVNKGYVAVGTSRAHYMMLRLADSYLNNPITNIKWPSGAFDEELLNEVVAHWEDEDTGYLNNLLHKVCNRHTYHVRRDTSSSVYDFQYWSEYHYPLEVLMVYRLREWRGLSKPNVEHPLLKAPFDVLPETAPKINSEKLVKVMRQVRKFWPDFDDVMGELKSGLSK